TSTNDTILYAIFTAAVTERLAAELCYLPYVVGVHVGQAFAACFLDSALGKAVDGRIALRNLHDLGVGVIREAADESRLSGQRKLNVAFSQGQLGLLALADIELHAYDADNFAFLRGARRRA